MATVGRYQQLDQAYRSLSELRQRDKNEDGQIVLAELDQNQDGKLDSEVCSAANMPDPALRQETQKRFEEAKANQARGLSSTVFVVQTLTDRLIKVDAETTEAVAPIKGLFQALRQSEQGRVALDAINTNDNGYIDTQELQDVRNKPELGQRVRMLIAKAGLDPALLRDIPVYLESIRNVDLEHDLQLGAPELNLEYGFDLPGQPPLENAKEQIQPMCKADAEHNERQAAIAQLRRRLPLNQQDAEHYKQLQAEERNYNGGLTLMQDTILSLSGHDPGINKLLNQLQMLGLANLENLSYLEKLSPTPGIGQVLAHMSDRFEAFLAASACGLNPTERKQLISNILHDVAWPDDIDQGNKGSCGAAALQTKLAILDAGKYAELCLTLAEGKAYDLTPGVEPGEHVEPNETWKYELPGQDQRPLSCKILQNSLMEFGHRHSSPEGPGRSATVGGQQVHFDSRVSADLTKDNEISFKRMRKTFPELAALDDQTLTELSEGLSDHASVLLDSLLMGKKVETLRNDRHNPQDMVRALEESLAQGRPVYITIRMESGATHAALIIKQDSSTQPPAFLVSTWRGLYLRTGEELERSLLSLQR